MSGAGDEAGDNGSSPVSQEGRVGSKSVKASWSGKFETSTISKPSAKSFVDDGLSGARTGDWDAGADADA